MLEKKLEKIGFQEKETKVYLGLLELGEGGVGEIAQKSGVKRTTVYHILEDLKARGLISLVKKGKKTLFSAEDPRSIGDDLKEKQAYFQSILPEILSVANFMEKKPVIKYFETLKGIKEIYRDELKCPDSEILAWWSDSYEIFGEDFFYNFYMPGRLANKIWVRVIAPDSEFTRKIQLDDVKDLRQIKFMPAMKQNAELEISLYGKSKISIKSFRENFGLIIESRPLFNTMKMMFEFAWQVLPEKKV
jgi:HTH-type transcriptional regulator, sugar sensing transcriptional regulator